MLQRNLALFVLGASGLFAACAQAATPAPAPAPCLPPTCIAYPADAGFLNVKDFGAKGDGVSDDTKAINAALAASGDDTGTTFWQDKIVYLPNGVYKVSGQIEKRYKEGRYASGMVLQGQSRDRTIIRLANNAPGYGDATNPKAIVFTSSKILNNVSPTNGGRDYMNKGEGNDAYHNYVENLTVDAGTGNPGAIGIDFLTTNMGAIRNVLVNANATSGAIGVSMKRKWPGPALLMNVIVQGFDVGIDVNSTEYGITMEAIRLLSQRQIGLRNNHNVLSTRDVTISGAPTGIVNQSPDGLIVIAGGTVTRSAPATGEAIVNNGSMNLRYLGVSNFATVMGNPLPGKVIDGVYEKGNRISGSQQSWSMPVTNPPPPIAEGPEKWLSVTAYGAVPDDPNVNSTGAIRKAFESGAATIYFPHGTYYISENIVVPSSVQHIVGMNSTIHAFVRRANWFSREQGMFRLQNSTNPLVIEDLAFDNSWLGDQVGVEPMGTKPVVLRDVVGAGVIAIKRPATGGPVYVENFCCGTMDFSGPANVWIRQFDSEGPGVRLLNNGASVWLLGVKTERNCTVVENRNGARTEVLGGLVYIVNPTVDPMIPAFRNTDSRMYLSYVEESFNPSSTYAMHLVNTQKKTTQQVMGVSLPARNGGRMAAGIVGQ